MAYPFLFSKEGNRGPIFNCDVAYFMHQQGSNVKCSAIMMVTHKKCKNVIGDAFALSYEGPLKLPS